MMETKTLTATKLAQDIVPLIQQAASWMIKHASEAGVDGAHLSEIKGNGEFICGLAGELASLVERLDGEMDEWTRQMHDYRPAFVDDETRYDWDRLVEIACSSNTAVFETSGTGGFSMGRRDEPYTHFPGTLDGIKQAMEWLIRGGRA
jgi:hypothetical protein